MHRSASMQLRAATRRFCASLTVLLAATAVSRAVDIQPSFDPNITPAQRAVINQKIALWEARLPHQNPEHVVAIEFRNGNLGTLLRGMRPGVEPMLAEDTRTTLAETDNFTSDANGRPTGARITINNNAAVPWYEGLDPSVPSDKYDLYTVVNHEIAHALGFTVNNPRFARNVTTTGGVRRYEGGGPGGTPTGTLTPASSGTHTDPGTHPGDLMNPGIPRGVRRLPSQLDIDILNDDVWAYPTIRGSLSNFDVWNRYGLIANDFQVTLGGVLSTSITDLYNGALNPFAPPPGTVTQVGNNVVIKWGPGPGQVNPGNQAHFGFKITGDLTPLSYLFEWTQNNVVIGSMPVNGSTWRLLTTGGVRNRVANTSNSSVWVAQSINFTPMPITLNDLLPGAPLDQTAIPIHSGMVQLVPEESLVFDYGVMTGNWGVVMITRFHADEGGVPGPPLGQWFDAAQLVGDIIPGDTNCDGDANIGDIESFVLLLLDPVAYHALYPGCDPAAGNCNADGSIDGADVQAFATLLLGR